MTAWEGFTDRELQRLKGATQPPVARTAKERDALDSAVKHDSAWKGVQTISSASKTRANMVLSSPEEALKLPSEAFIGQPTSPPTETADAATHAPKTGTDRNGASAHSPSARPSSLHPVQTPEGSNQSTKGEGSTPTGPLQAVQSEVDLCDQPTTSLDALQKKRKEIEEENQQKKKLLHQVLAERYEKTTAESQTLAVVKQELEKIDTILSNDVFILRDKIEEVNRKFECSRKRFEHAEEEYVTAKLELHQAAEAKELIAEHLCSIIQQNEMRKANKLAELMTKLNLGDPAANGGLTPPGSEAVVDMKYFQRTPTPAIHRSQAPKVRSPSAVLADTGSLPPDPEPPAQQQTTESESTGSTVNAAESEAGTRAGGQEPPVETTANYPCAPQ